MKFNRKKYRILTHWINNKSQKSHFLIKSWKNVLFTVVEGLPHTSVSVEIILWVLLGRNTYISHFKLESSLYYIFLFSLTQLLQGFYSSLDGQNLIFIWILNKFWIVRCVDNNHFMVFSFSKLKKSRKIWIDREKINSAKIWVKWLFSAMIQMSHLVSDDRG